MTAAVENIEHRYRQYFGIESAQMTVERNIQFICRRPCRRDGDCQRGIGTEFGFVRGAVQIYYGAVNGKLVAAFAVFQQREDAFFDICYGFADAKTVKTFFFTVAQFECFARTGGYSGGNTAASPGSGFEDDIHFNSGISTGIKNFPRQNVFNFRHNSTSPSFCVIVA